MEYLTKQVSELTKFTFRGIRPAVVEKLKERMSEGYNPARPITITADGMVIDGNHRVEAARLLGIKELPCLMRTGDPYKIAAECNADEDTYAPMDLFDWLDVIASLKAAKLTQQAIGDRIGWSEGAVKQYSVLLNKIVTQVLELAKDHQEGRVTEKVTNVTFTFTEGWFRASGIYELADDDADIAKQYQMMFMQWFVNERKCSAASKLIKEKVAELVGIKNQLKMLDEALAEETEEAKVAELKEAILRGEYNDKRLAEVIATLNDGAKNKAIYGKDSLECLKAQADCSVDLVITDPPYGVDYKPSRPTGKPTFNDEAGSVLEYLDSVFAELKRVCKENAHIYVFGGCVNAFEFKSLLEKYFTVQNNWLVWEKGNHTPCDFKQRYASKYEIIWFCKMPKGNERKLNNSVSPDVLHYPTPQNKRHDCQKPIDLLEYLINNSSGKNETVLDPFAGSGSTLLAAEKAGRYYIGFELEAKYKAGFLKELEK
jgi:site-specific DNA-methyltransferase (adenine-specific)